MADVFARYGGQALEPESTPAPAPASDPFAKYGGVAAPAEDAAQGEEAADPFAKYGGSAATEEPVRTDIDSLSKRTDREVIQDEDLAEIGRTHGVDPKYLREWTGWLSGIYDPGQRRGVEHITESLKSGVGSVGEGVLFGIPQAIAKKFGVEDAAKRRALDDLAALIDKRKTTSQAATEMALGVAAPIGISAKAVQGLGRGARALVGMAEGAAVGGVSGYAHSSEGDELRDTAFGAGLGLILAGGISTLGAVAGRRAATEAADDVTARASGKFQAAQEAETQLERSVVDTPAVRESVRERDLIKFLDSTTPEERAAIARLADPDAKLSSRVVSAYGDEAARAWAVARDTVGELDVRLGVGGRRGGVRDVVAQEGREHVGAVYRGMREAHYIKQELAELTEKQIGRPGALRKGMALFSDLRHVTDAIDDRLGTRLTPVIDRMSANYNRFTDDMARVGIKQAALNKQLVAAEAEAAKAGTKFDLHAALEAGPEAWAKMPPKQAEAAKAWAEGFEWLRTEANRLGVPVEKLAGTGYVPHKAVDPVEFVQRVEARAEALGITAEADDEVLEALLATARNGDVESRDLVQALKMARGGEVTEAVHIREALNGMQDLSRVGHRLETVAGSSMQRDGAIPAWLLETDVTRLFPKWAHSTFRHARIRGELQEVRSTADAIRGANPEAASYLDRYVEDLVGIRAQSAAAAQGEFLQRVQLKMLRAARKAGEGTAKGVYYTLAARLPDALPFMAAQIYPFALGARVDKLVQNLMSPFVLGLPTIGYKNVKYILGGVQDLIRIGPKQTLKLLVDAGLTPTDAPLEAHRWLADGIERSPAKRLGRAGLEATNKLAMSLYQRTDQITRGITFHAARRLADGVRKGDAGALDALQSAGAGYQSLFRQKLSQGQDITSDVAAWLNGATQFNYNRASMSEYGRFAGSLFSTFSKWPTSIAGDIAGHLDRGSRQEKMTPEMVKLGMKYLVPWIALAGIQGALDAEGPAELKNVVGQDVTSAAPLSSVSSVVQGRLAGPLPRAASELVSAGMEREPKKMAAVLLKSLGQFTPGGWIARLIYQDLPAWQGGARPKQAPVRLLIEDLGAMDD